MTGWRPISECQRVPGRPYVLNTTNGPVLAEWDDGMWVEWLRGTMYGLFADDQNPLEYLEVPQ